MNEIENVYGETVEFYDLSALSQIGNKKIVLNKFADMVKDLDGIILDIGAGTGKTTIEISSSANVFSISVPKPSDAPVTPYAFVSVAKRNSGIIAST